MLHLGIVFNKELPSKGAMAAGARIARDAGGDGEVLAMSAGSSLEDAGLAIYEGDATGIGVVGAACGWRLHVSVEAPTLGQPSRLAFIPTQLTRLPHPVLHFFREKSEVQRWVWRRGENESDGLIEGDCMHETKK